MTCPKCSGPMRTYERNGVHVDQCADCRGLFLDRGELERLVDAENAWHGDRPSGGHSAGAPAAGGAGLGAVVSGVLGSARGREQQRYDDGRHDQYGRPYGSGHPKRKKSFLDQLFD